MRTPLFLLCSAAFAMGSCAMGPPYAPAAVPAAVPAGAATLTTADKAPFGTFLVDGAGRSVYILDGTRHSSGAMACGFDCARVWPPVMSSSPPALGAGLNPQWLGTAPRGGGTQLTYAGWPLFYYVRDRGPGDTTGQNVHDAWGGWYLLSPSGEPIHPVGHY
jgi:predicted lipoprotein with Yx(FWY)xxD motif